MECVGRQLIGSGVENVRGKGRSMLVLSLYQRELVSLLYDNLISNLPISKFEDLKPSSVDGFAMRPSLIQFWNSGRR